MATLPTLVPTGNGTMNGWSGSYADIDEGTTIPLDTDYVQSPAAAADQCFFDVTDTPADFVTMTSLTLVIRYAQSGWSDDTMGLYAQIFASDETTALTAELTVAAAVTNLVYTTSSTLNFTGVVAGTKAQWDGARIRLRCTYSQSMGKDSGFVVRVSALQLGGVYTQPTAKSTSDAPALSVSEARTVTVVSTTTDAPAVACSDSSTLVKANGESLTPDGILTQTNLTGALSTIQDNPDSPDANWMTSSGAVTLRVSFPTPAQNLKAGFPQKFRIRARPGS